MAVYTYTPAGQYGATGYFLFADKNLTIPASLTDANGVPLSANQVNLNSDGSWPAFQSSSSPLWFLDEEGTKVQLSPGLAYGSPQAVTGSRGTATAAVIENLIQALIAAGVPITDQTTA